MITKKYFIILSMAFIFTPFVSFANDDEFADDYDYDDDVVMITGDVENGYLEEPDNIEEFNRGMYGFNDTIDQMMFEPIARGYRAVVPQWGRNRVSSAVDNLNSPVVFVNSILQGNAESAFASFWRFVINSTLGIGGLLDVAGAAGLEPVREDFGQTLAVWGKEDSNYFMLPILGPSTGRDTAGLIVDTVLNPLTYVGFPTSIVIQGSKLVSKREALLDVTDEIEETSFDPYATVRSAYFQHRKKEISK